VFRLLDADDKQRAYQEALHSVDELKELVSKSHVAPRD